MTRRTKTDAVPLAAREQPETSPQKQAELQRLFREAQEAVESEMQKELRSELYSSEMLLLRLV